jgi:pyrimidine deaminase RibD-like protein
VEKTFSDPYPTNLNDVQVEIDYWASRQHEGLPGSSFDQNIRNRLEHLRHLYERYSRQAESSADTTGRSYADDLKFARMAIEEARMSVAEADGRIHPKVGAVVVKDGRVLSTAHRGESSGCHAEFIALEKKLDDALVTGATVYTTLEPCTTRKHPKVPCASRLVERRVERVVIGMLDPNPEITGKGQRALRRGRITTDFFHSELMAEVEELNREFTRMYEPHVADTQQGTSLPSNRPEIAITGWGPNKNPDRPEYQAQHGFYLHNSGRETAIGIRVQEFQIPFEIPDAWISVEVPFIDRTKDGFIPVYRKLGGRPTRWDLEGFLLDAYKDKGPGNKTIRITARYRDAKRGYFTHQDLVFSPEIKRIVSFGAPRQELDTELPH